MSVADVITRVDDSLAGYEVFLRQMAETAKTDFAGGVRYLGFPKTATDDAIPMDGEYTPPNNLSDRYPFEATAGHPSLADMGVGDPEAPPPLPVAFSLVRAQGFTYPVGFFVRYDVKATVGAGEEAYGSEGDVVIISRTIDYGSDGRFDKPWHVTGVTADGPDN